MRISSGLLLLAALVPVLSSPQGRPDNISKDCPRKCWCYQTAVRCMFQGITRVPRVSGNSTILDLRFNDIVDIPPGTFHGLKNLDTILLNDNKVRHLKANAFVGLSNLTILYLYKNRITSVAVGAFAHLPNLRQLYLHENRLTEIEPRTFSDLPKLERLFLQNNRLHRIPADAFENVGPMTRLRLDSNALVCDCDLLWLVERLREGPSETTAVCQAPVEMEGRSLTSMSTEDFHCHVPKIMKGPEDIHLAIGETASFSCKVVGDPKPKIKWMRNSDEVNPDGSRYIIKEDGTLVISDISENDVGEYECIAESKMGSIASRKARAVITATPSIRFTEIPNSQSVTAGEDIIFTCKAEARPSPRIEWWRNGQRIRGDDRMFLEDEGMTLRIISTTTGDSARYVCQGRNINGFAEVSADLKVVSENASPPRFTYEPPENMETELGATVELPCRSEGEPKPIIHWKKDGSALEPIPRYRISRGGSLYIQNITLSDSGRYECTAANDYGRATAQSLLKVKQALVTSNSIVHRAFQDATDSIDRAVNQTLARLFGIDGAPPTGHSDPFRIARFPNKVARANARPAEIFERTLVNIRKFVNQGMKANVSGPFNYTDILTHDQVREIEKLADCTGHRQKPKCNNLCFHSKYRTIDGTCNNLKHTTWGSSYTGFRRILQPIYENGFSQPIGWDKTRLYFGFTKPAARLISTKIISTNKITSDDKLTHMLMQWGQFLDHDLDHALPAVSSESWDGIDCKKSCENAAPCFPMEVPPGDPRITNRRCIDFVRSSAVCGSGMTSILWGHGMSPREQMNQLTSYIDASQVYGYDDDLARDLRELQSDRGLLREGAALPGRKAMLPYMSGQFVDCRRNPQESSINCFVTGDFRANEQVGLLAMHTIWLREHNRIARSLGEFNPHWSGEKLYQEARKIVGAEMQHITYQQWMPKVFGKSLEELIGAYSGYDPDLDPRISNVFATAALRFGHSLIQPRLERLNETFGSIPQGPLSLRDAFFSPWRLVDEGGVDPLLRGMFATAAKLKLPEQNLNSELTEELFKTAHAVALDLAAMNIQRAREHGIPGYLEWRKYCGMASANDFEDLAREISNPRVRRKLKELYGHPGNMDVWVGGILEDQLPNAKVGPLFNCLLLEQFRRSRDGDRFWYENPSTFKSEQLQQIKQISLARILCDNGDNITRVQRDVFQLPEGENSFINCDEIPSINLRFWSDCCENCEVPSGNGIPRFRREAEKYMEHMNVRNIRDLERQVKDLQVESQKLKDQAKEMALRFKILQAQLSSQIISNFK
ncbi:peroxidasin homolog [Diachasma alloeum]|uniref:peroxidasin homolog n=1 Tax=Diachasma alloeum TaxID=454923 RepID=UPI0007382E00|nr:peroxidasin homolog [Diachasma alloeum]